MKLELDEDQKLLVSLAMEKSNGFIAEAGKLESEAKALRAAGDSLIADALSRIATKKGMALPKEGRAPLKWLAADGKNVDAVEIGEAAQGDAEVIDMPPKSAQQ